MKTTDGRSTASLRSSYTYKDLEDVARLVFELSWRHSDGWNWQDGYNKSRVLLEAVEAVAFTA